MQVMLDLPGIRKIYAATDYGTLNERETKIVNLLKSGKYTPKEVGEELKISRDCAQDSLYKLHNKNAVNREQLGNGYRYWSK